jgi:hypothetical protein
MTEADAIWESGWGDLEDDDNENDEDYDEDEDEDDDCSGLEDYRRRMQGRINVPAAASATNTAKVRARASDDSYSDSDDSSDYDDDPKGGGGGKGGGNKRNDEFHRAQQAFYDSMLYDKDDPRPGDVGKFLTGRELRQWRLETAPKFYAEEFKMYVDDDGPHGFGTKIELKSSADAEEGDFLNTFKFTILGSKIFEDDFFPQPWYIVRQQGNVYDLMKMEVTKAHEEYQVGWDDEKDDLDESVFDLLPKPPPPPIQDEREAKFQRAEERHEHNMKKLVDWQLAVDGPFEEIFISKMFPENHVTLAEVRNDYTLEYRALILEILLGYARERKEASILENERDSKWLVIEYYGPSKVDGVVPALSIQFAISYERERAVDFVREDVDDLKFIKCSGRAMNAIQNHLLKTCCGRGLNDVMSGLLLFEGWIAPMEPPAPSVTQLFDTRGYVERFRGIPERRFGVEFELSCTLNTPNGQLAYHLQRFAGVRARNIHERNLRDPLYLLGMQNTDKYSDEWQIDRDGSIIESPDYPNSSNIELISPILKGEAGVDECKRVLNVLNDVTALLLNKSMGVHVHIEVLRPSLETLKSISTNFLLYEDAIDTFMAESRRSGANKYCRSNLRTLMKVKGLNSKHEAIATMQKCQGLDELYDLVNPKGRYHKMNLQNLKTGKRPTIEFRQHSATSEPRLAEPWIRFCMALVYNSIRLGPLDGAGKDSAAAESEFDELFDRLIQDPELKRFYRIRREELQTAGDTSDMVVGIASQRSPKGGHKLGTT